MPQHLKLSRPLSPAPSDEYIVIGIDFGTTYSGVSWIDSETWISSNYDLNCIQDVIRWPQSEGNYEEVQVPTLTDPDSDIWGAYCIDRNVAPVKWFKLLLLDHDDLDLDPNPNLSRNFERLRETRAYRESGIVGVVAKFLERFWRHTLEQLELDRGAAINVPLKVAITVPAVWKPYAKERMKMAAVLAGITEPRYVDNTRLETSLFVVDEPAAAAAWTLRYHRPDTGRGLEVGETCIVCDCGGGTVDIVTFVVTSIEPFKVQQIGKGDGALCGAFRIDQAFENHIKASPKFKFERCSFQEYRDFLDQEWECGLKRNFEPPKEINERLAHVYAIHPPASAIYVPAFERAGRFLLNKGSKPAVLEIDSGVIRKFFDQSLLGIRRLISRQFDRAMRAGAKKPSTIFFVGGLAASNYLHSEITEIFRDRKWGARVLQAKDPWSAVARGAVISVLENEQFAATSQISQLYYGVQAWCSTDQLSPPINPKLDQISQDSDGNDLVLRMKWFLKKGESFSGKEPVSHEFHLDFELEEDTDVSVMLYVSDGKPPSCRLSSSVHELFNLRHPLRIAQDKLPVVEDAEGKIYRRRLAGIKLAMTFDGQPKLALKVGNIITEMDVNIADED
ncbi:hypothetical protein QBC43DRAFT_352161 [Cladorrhinum sp. PSN259]|nr:hypothetical protein QBC43DRAFT_352161 [Cladorrhinum sp. PSN259]